MYSPAPIRPAVFCPGTLGMLADFKNSVDDDEERRFRPPLREQDLSRF